jgi:hypothetical protein
LNNSSTCLFLCVSVQSEITIDEGFLKTHKEVEKLLQVVVMDVTLQSHANS